MIETSPRLNKFAQLKREMEAGSGAKNPSGPVAQLTTAISYDPRAINFPNGTGEMIGHDMQAYMDPEDPIKGTKTNGKEIPLSMQYFADKYPNGASGWHRGHLLNAKLGGLNIGPNLAPFTNSMNTGAHSDAEEVVKRLMGIGVPCGYRVTYAMTEAPDKSSMRVSLVVKVDPRPRDEDDEAELNKRTGLEGINARMASVVTGANVEDRPRSPQPTEVSSLDPDLPLVSGSAYSHLNDHRIENRGWGILKNEAGRDVSLTKGQQSSVEDALAVTEYNADREILLGADGYKARFEADEDYWAEQALDWLDANMPGAKQILLDDAAGELDSDEHPEEEVEALLDQFQSRNEKLYTEFMHYFWR